MDGFVGPGYEPDAPEGFSVAIGQPMVSDKWVCERVGLARLGEVAFQTFEARVKGEARMIGNVEYLA